MYARHTAVGESNVGLLPKLGNTFMQLEVNKGYEGSMSECQKHVGEFKLTKLISIDEFNR